MKPLKKLFEYVWPQWPRLVAAISTAIMVGFLQSISIATLAPILTVIMGDTGLHGWIDYKACNYRYGLRIYEVTSHGSIRISKVDPNSLADQAGLKALDIIELANEPNTPADPNENLVTLASPIAPQINLTVYRAKEGGGSLTEHLTLMTDYDSTAPPPPSFWKQTGLFLEKLSRDVRLWGAKQIQSAIAFLPREKTPENTMNAVLLLLGFGIAVTMLRCVTKFCQIYLSQKIMMVADCQLREDLFSHILGMPAGTFAQDSPSDAVSRITRDTSEMANMLRIVFGKALREPLIALFALAFAMSLNWRLTLIFLLGGPLVIGSVAWLGKKMRKATRKSLEASAQVLGKLEETIAGIKVVKVFNRSAYEQTAFANINRRLLKQHLRISRVDAMTPPLLEILALCAGVGAIVVGVRSANEGTINNAEFLTLILALGVAAESLRRSSDIWNYVQRANAAAGRIFEVMDHPLEIEAPNALDLPTFKQAIKFKDIVFKYESRPEPILKGINLTIQAGETVALVGPNGSGKTTLANLLPRFYDPMSGMVTLDETDIRDVSLHSLRDQMSLVTQQSVTFNDTIALNIAYGKLDATQEEIETAAKQAHAHEFITQLPKGYQTVIGEHGTGLSGGQLQRIVIARAIVKNPAILIFDEATSQVDAESEAKIHEAIEAIMKNRTTIMIAHRFSTVVSADKIVVIDQGQIAAEGQHDQLIKECKLYQALYETQLM